MNGTYLQYPSNCKACIDRSELELKQFNPYFILMNKNKFQTRICYEKSQAINTQEKYYYDSFTQTIVVCNKYQQCYNKIIIHQNLHCDSSTYYEQSEQSNDEYFEKKNDIQKVQRHLNFLIIKKIFLQGTFNLNIPQFKFKIYHAYFDEDLQIFSKLAIACFFLIIN
ncbi:unnamed protein product [Paramecium primaurelia]|uniref:Uncharacterized protein n=1 Tax=Paramecium primaurelia TaxID=5886 RepID=A0A8S1QVQ2_PARPR|nr:unnamed protein product [Paramecium primaurelia]